MYTEKGLIKKKLEILGISPEICCLETGECKDKAYCIEKVSDIWIVYYCKKKRKESLKTFDNQQEAYDYLFGFILWDETIFNQVLRKFNKYIYINTVKKIKFTKNSQIDYISILKEKLKLLGLRSSYNYTEFYTYYDDFIINKCKEGWEVYYGERGNKNCLKVFDSEKEACIYFLAFRLTSSNFEDVFGESFYY